MKSITTLFPLLSLFYAHVSAQILSPIRILYRWELEPDNHGIAAFNNDNELIGQACAPTLDTGNFEKHPLSISVDHETPWIGTITVGPKTHALTSHPRERDDPSCSWIYNEHVIEADCLVVRNGSMSITTTAPEKMGCFSEAYQAWDLTAGQKLHDPPQTML